ncbi:hypothetical protein M419DRAFT_121605 [Trichoderma reesei RUT C-30]|uniref:Uncharacterized protein n=1 Tax=Hypocrea jecorina (strain ATCC 56765 / BCRC 32924 / NRRL 11460 / Rut C-30) TaxID=1344414 RepID=A0A024SMS5_HYPJR|nr:hypothetical protein M419DRAFT_121605 [Trichoderma reesei RUT C-30]
MKILVAVRMSKTIRADKFVTVAAFSPVQFAWRGGRPPGSVSRCRWPQRARSSTSSAMGAIS